MREGGVSRNAARLHGSSHHPCAPAHRKPRSLQARHENRRAPRATEGVGAGSTGYDPGSHCPNLQKLRGGSSYYGLHQPIHPAILTHLGDECPTVIGGKSHRVISQTSLRVEKCGYRRCGWHGSPPKTPRDRVFTCVRDGVEAVPRPSPPHRAMVGVPSPLLATIASDSVLLPPSTLPCSPF